MEAPNELFNQICRACMKKKKAFTDMREQCADIRVSIFEMFNRITQTDLEFADEMPALICLACLNKLTKSYSFQKMCILSDTIIRKLWTDRKQKQRTEKQKKLDAKEAELNSELAPPEPPLLGRTEPLIAHQAIELDALFEEKVDTPQVISESQEFCHANAELSIKLASPQSPFIVIASNIIALEQGVEEKDIPPNNGQEDVSYALGKSLAAVGEFEDVTIAEKTGYFIYSDSEPGNTLDGSEFISEANGKTEKVATRSKTLGKKPRKSKTELQEIFKCSECSLTYQHPISLANHFRIYHEVGKTHECKMCGSIFPKLAGLIKHKRRHGIRNYKCTECEKSFISKSELIGHINTHKGLQPFECDICHKVFEYASRLKTHKQIMHGDRNYPCPTCNQVLASKLGLKRHLNTHSNKRPYKCPHCPYRCGTKSNLKIHINAIHNKLRNFICDTCGITFNSSHYLQMHKLQHTGERPYECKVCKARFRCLQYLQRHQNIHTGEKPYKCKYCHRAYTQPINLNFHLRTHVGEKIHICSQCPETFKYYVELRKHSYVHYTEDSPTAGATETAAASTKTTAEATKTAIESTENGAKATSTTFKSTKTAAKVTKTKAKSKVKTANS